MNLTRVANVSMRASVPKDIFTARCFAYS